jgi:hypothetical protein
MAIDDKELDQRLKDQLRMIEMGETLEDLNDPEEYDDEGGIRSLRKAPSIKMASETGEEEFDMELMGVINEYNDLKQKGDPAVRDISVEEYINMYLSRKKMMKDRAMAMGGGMMRMGYAGGSEDIKEPSKSMQMDTTTGEGANIFNMYYDDQDLPIKKEGKKLDLDIEKIKKLIEKRKKEKKKLAMGGIAGVL